MRRKYLNKITFFLITLCIAAILWLTWIQNPILHSDTMTFVLCIALLVYFIIDCNCWVFEMRGFTHGVMSLTHIWVVALYYHLMPFIELLLLTVIFLYIRDQYLKKKGIWKCDMIFLEILKNIMEWHMIQFIMNFIFC